MNKYFKLCLAILPISLLSQTTSVAQRVYPSKEFQHLANKWSEYETTEINHNLFQVTYNFYRDTISVKEMKEAFYQHRNDEKDNRKLNLQNFDVLTSFPSRGDKYFVVTPRRNDRKNSIKNYSDLGDGEIISLSNPQWYMGFQLSPRAHFYVYHQGKPVAIAPYATYSDFFAYAAYKPIVTIDGPYEWVEDAGFGARLIGNLHTMKTAIHWGLIAEKQFSVLLYTQTYERSNRVSYSLELLEPKEPDSTTKELFCDLKRFIEHIPSKAFAPYFTTDLRLMTGRYYRVTVNKCGWLIEDYITGQVETTQ